MKKRTLFLLGLLCLCLTFSIVGRAQTDTLVSPKTTGTISGVLTDSLTGKAIEFVTVALLQKGSTTAVGGTLTNAQGQFSFQNINFGEYTLAFSFIGYKTKTSAVISLSEGTPEVQISSVKLSLATTNLKEVTIQGLRPTITHEADKMVVSIEGTALAAGRTAFDVVAKAPGVFIDHEGNIQLNGRAGVTLMLDGKLTYLSARDLRNLLEGMSAENIKNIEIITNPSAKFDAEGASGILNINLKKNDLRGINGSIYAGYTYNGKQHGYSTGGNIFHRAGKWSSFANLDMARRVGGREATFTRVYYAKEKTTYFDQVATGNFEVQGPPSIRIGTDYNLTDQHSIGVTGNFATNLLHADFLTETYMGASRQQPNLYIDAKNYTTNRFTNFTSNLHYLGKLDTIGSTLSADLDVARITNRGYSDFYNFYSDLETGEPTESDFLYTNTPNGFNIYSGKIDFTKSLTRKRKFELGAKASRVISENDSRFYFNNAGLELDPKRTNYFIYTENILAGYANWSSKLGEHITIQAGLRAEKTMAEGELVTTGEVNKRDYLDLFPSLFLQQKVSDNYQVSYSYSRRLQRPNYGNLNPFISYRDPYTYWVGNPVLRPQYTHAFGLTQTIKKDYSLVLNYQLIQDMIAEIVSLDVEKATTIYTVGNVNDGYSVSATANAPVKIIKNWDTQNTLVVSYNKYNIMVGERQATNDQVFYMVQSNHNLLLPLGLKLEVNMAYRGPGAYALYEVASQWWVNVGLKKSFLNDKLDLSLNANDLFKGQRVKVSTVGDQINEFDQYFRARNIGVTLRYNFNKGQKFDPKRRNNTLDEINRT